MTSYSFFYRSAYKEFLLLLWAKLCKRERPMITIVYIEKILVQQCKQGAQIIVPLALQFIMKAL